MKKILLVAAVAVCVFGSVQAQFHYGLKAGVNLVEPDVKGFDVKSVTGFQVGPMIEFIVPVIGIGFDAAALYSQDEFKTDANKNLLIPVNLKYKLSLAGIVGAYAAVGPYASFNIDNDGIAGVAKAKSFGAGLNFGIGAEIFSKLQVGVTYQLGLTDNYEGAGALAGEALDSKVSGVVISLAYWF
ncbi:membrane protein [Bacteroidia bacterium]|nr:membrane protein [Bacteroidia bacterium]